MSVMLANVLFSESIVFPHYFHLVSFERTLGRKSQVGPSHWVFLKHQYCSFLFPMWILICYCVFNSLESLPSFSSYSIVFFLLTCSHFKVTYCCCIEAILLFLQLGQRELSNFLVSCSRPLSFASVLEAVCFPWFSHTLLNAPFCFLCTHP